MGLHSFIAANIGDWQKQIVQKTKKKKITCL